MTGYIFSLTLRQLIGRKTTLALVGLCALPVLIAFVFRISTPSLEPDEWTSRVLMNGLIFTVMLPLTALMLGTSVLGDELEDGTAIFLLTKPLPRWQILFPKAAGAFVVIAALTVSSTFIACSLAEAPSDLTMAFTIGVLAAAFAYTLLFVLLSVLTTRALISGLVYVFLWEGAITAIFEGLRHLSVRHYALGIADALADVPASVLDAYLSGTTAVVLLVVLSVCAAFWANRRLERTEVREPS